MQSTCRVRTRPRRPMHLAVKLRAPVPSPLLATFWRFACERQATFFRRISGQPPPWTNDPIIETYRFTNVYRALDRVSQFLIQHVIYNPALPQASDEVVFRILLFKLFNKIETWQLLEGQHGPLQIGTFDQNALATTLDRARASGVSVYSAAYIMPSTAILGEKVKHRGHLKLLDTLIRDRVADRLQEAASLGDTFALLKSYPTLGNFLAYQLAIDLNYSEVLQHSEDEFVVPGPGASDGIRKCFSDLGSYTEADVIKWVADRQEIDTHSLGLQLPTLFGRRLHLIDIQNLFCEVSKYTRVSHPEVSGSSGRVRIKQVYRPMNAPYGLVFPPKWDLNDRIPQSLRHDGRRHSNADLWTGVRYGTE